MTYLYLITKIFKNQSIQINAYDMMVQRAEEWCRNQGDHKLIQSFICMGIKNE